MRVISIPFVSIPTTLSQTWPSTSVPTTTLPMTSMFTPPPGCANSWTWEPPTYNWVKPSGLLMQNCETVVSSCFPSGFANSGRLAATQVYNPGACPVGYTSAFVAVGEQVTTAVCCYSNFVYTTSQMDYSNGPPTMYAGCTSSLPEKSSTFVYARGAEADQQVQITGSMIMWAQPITVEFVASELSQLGIKYQTATSTSQSTASTTDSSASQQSTTTSSTTSQASQTSLTIVNVNTSQTSPGSQASVPNPSSTTSTGLSLSTGAKIGIGVGAGVGAILISVFVLLWLSRHRKAKANAATMRIAPGGHPPYNYNPKELPGGFPPPAGGIERPRGPPMELDNGDYSNYSGKYIPELQG